MRDEAAARPGPAPAKTGLGFPAICATLLFGAFLALDRLPRFYQGDSLAYLTTGTNNWIPPDRSWIYGFGARWLVEGTGSVSALVACQALLLLGAVLLACRAMRAGQGTGWAVAVFAAVAALDPLNQAYARFWLSDTPAEAAFIAFAALLACSIAAPSGRLRRVAPWLAACAAAAVFVRVAYAPILVGTLVTAAAVASLYPARLRPPRLRRRLLALAALPVVAVGVLAGANSVVAVPSLRGQVFVNQMSDLYTLGVFLPALRYQDFVEAGVPVTQAEFDSFDRSLDAREAQVWVDGPGHVRWVMMQRLGVDQVYDERFQRACAAVVRTALRQHPQDLALTYLAGLASTFDARRWHAVMHGEMGFDQPLPAWAAEHLTWVTGRTVLPSVTGQPSLLPGILERTAGIYPVLLLAGAAAAVLVLAFARPFGARHILAAAMLAALLVTPLFSHALKPRYLLAPVMLSEALLSLLAFSPATLRTTLRAGRSLVRTPMLPAAAALLCLAAYAGQLGLGRWQTDEFTLFANQRAGGLHVLGPRLTYAPRPVSEAVLFLYGMAVNALGRPLIAPFLALLWVGVAAAGIGAAWWVLPPSRWRAVTTVALPASLFAFVLVSSDVTEAFYWPMAAAAYLPVAGAATALAFLLSQPLTRARRLGSGAALLTAAGSCEMGAALAVTFALAAAVEAAMRPERPRGLAAMQDAAWWIVPGLVGAAALAVIVTQRANIVELGADTQPYTGHLLASAGMTVRQAVLDLLDGGAAAPGVLLAAKLAFAAGFAGVWRAASGEPAVPQRMVAVLAAALAGAAGFSVLTAFYHYGTLCCERQGTTRFWLVTLLLALAAHGLAAWWPGAGRLLQRRPWAAPALLAASLLPVLGLVGGLRQDYDMLELARGGRTRTWLSGRQPGTGAMEFYMPPDGKGMLIHGTGLPVGRYPTSPSAVPMAPEMIRELGRYFGKEVVFACQPWQTEKSWLLNGQFIPACPPHDGPPDIVYPPP